MFNSEKYYEFIKSVGEVDYTEQRVVLSCTNMDRLLMLAYTDGLNGDVFKLNCIVPTAKLENPDAKR